MLHDLFMIRLMKDNIHYLKLVLLFQTENTNMSLPSKFCSVVFYSWQRYSNPKDNKLVFLLENWKTYTKD